MPSIIDNLIKFLTDNFFWFIFIGVGIGIIVYYFSPSFKEKMKPLNRSDIERKNFIERNKLNESIWNWFYRGNTLLGKIIYLKQNITVKKKDKDGEKEFTINEFVIKPTITKWLKIANPLAKEICLQIETLKCEKDLKDMSIKVDDRTIFNNLLGIFYDIDLSNELEKHIIDDSLLRTDFNNIASIYFVKSQEQSTYAPEYAHQLAMKEKELQVELAKKRGKMTSI